MSVLNTLNANADDRPSLINRQLDFWLLGGASIAFWAICVALELLNPIFDTAQAYSNAVPAMFGFFVLIVNSPHFMASYHLAYSRGRGFIVGNWFQLIFVPVTLVTLLILGDLLFFSTIESTREFGLALNYALEPLGIFLVVGTFSSLGPELLHHMLAFMFLTVGWHYAKQVFGCMMVYSRFDNYNLDATERNLVKASLLTIWGYNYFSSNIQMQPVDMHSALHMTHTFPSLIPTLFQWITLALFLFVAYYIFYRRWRNNGQLPPAPAVAAWIAMFIWWMPFMYSVLFAIAVPFFHSLQYLPFYKKVIDAQYNDPAVSARSFNFYFAFCILFGFIAFNIGPEAIDYLRESEDRTTLTYWIAGITIFINIHHYFIDNTIWRLRDEKVRRWLLS